MMRFLIIFCLMLPPFFLRGQHVTVHAYRTKNPNHTIDADGTIRDQNGRVLASRHYGNVDDYIEVDGKSLNDAHKLLEKLSRQGRSGKMTIHTTVPSNKKNGIFNQPVTLPFGNSVEQDVSPIFPEQPQPARPIRPTSVQLPKVTPWELKNIAIDVRRPVKVRLHAVEMLMKESTWSKNQKALQEIVFPVGPHAAVNRENDAVRVAAVRGVTDTRLLKKLSSEDLSLSVRKEAQIRLMLLKSNKR